MKNKGAYTPPQCRLYAIFAREAPIGVIFRRGPSRHTLQILWDTKTDTFTDGQWLIGGLKPDRGDLSPDGKLLAYFASNRHNLIRRRNEGFEDSWTGISHPPYFSPLTVFPVSGTMSGGGFFLSNTFFCLDGMPRYNPQDPDWQNAPAYHPDYPAQGIEIQYKSKYFRKDGITPQKPDNGWVKIDPDNSIRTSAKQGLSKHERLVRHYLSYPNDYHYELEKRGKITPMEQVDWADYDQRGRLVYAKGGTLWARLENGDHRQLADFTDRTFRKLPPPPDALKW